MSLQFHINFRSVLFPAVALLAPHTINRSNLATWPIAKNGITIFNHITPPTFLRIWQDASCLPEDDTSARVPYLVARLWPTTPLDASARQWGRSHDHTLPDLYQHGIRSQVRSVSVFVPVVRAKRVFSLIILRFIDQVLEIPRGVMVARPLLLPRCATARKAACASFVDICML